MTIPKIKLPALVLIALTMGILFVFSFGSGFVAQKRALAVTSNTVNFQARLMASSGAIVPDGNYNVEFKIYNTLTSTGSSQGSCTGDAACLWTETRTSANQVRVVNGYLTANLGSVTSFPSNINWDQNLYLTMNIGGTGASPTWDGEMSPRLKLTAVPYAFRAGQLATNNGTFSSTLGFTNPTANDSILLPDASGTVCLQSSAACGFALSTGSGSYIQNGTSVQSGANFNISGTGIAATALQAPLLDTASAGTLNIGTTNATAISLNQDTTLSTGNLLLSNSGGNVIRSTTGALSIRANGTNILTLNTSGAGTVNIGTDNTTTINLGGGVDVARTINLGNPASGTAAQTVTLGSAHGTSTTLIQGGSGASAISIVPASGGNINVTTTGAGSINLTTGNAGVIIKPTTNNSAALQVQNASGLSVISTDTASGTITLGSISTTSGQNLAGKLLFADGTLDGFSSTLNTNTVTANRTISLPDASGTLCLQGSSACGFAPTSGSANYIQNTTSVQAANVYIQNNGSTSADTAIFRFSSGQTGDAIKVLNAAGTGTVWEVQPSLVTQTVPLKLNPTTLTAFTTPLGSSVSTAINIPLMDPGAFGQILAFGLPSTAAASSRAISVFDARTATGLQPSIALFNPNENDAFGLSWNGSTTVASLETLSGNIALRPGGTNTQLYAAASGGVAIGTNFQSPAYPLDVAGDINTSTALRVAGTSVCDTVGTTGCVAKSGSGYYIHNQTTVQSANIFVQAAASGSVAATLQANAAGTGDILDLKNGSGTNVATFGSTGSVSLQNSTNSTTAFQVQNVSGSQLLNVDTTNNVVSLNGGSSRLGPWHQGNSLPLSLTDAGSASANGFVYSVGGYDGGNKNSVYFAQQNSDGSIGSWQSGTNLPVALTATSVVIANNYIYVMGGQGSSSSVATVYYATINPTTGTVGSWTTSANPLPTGLAWGAATVANGYVYFAGGYTGSASVSTVYYSALNAGTGANGSWTTSSNALPAARDSGGLSVMNNYLYYTGGFNGSTINSTVYYVPINAATGAVSSSWTTSSNALPAIRALHSSVATNGYLYVIGGEDESTTQSTVYYAKQGTSGAIAAWSSGTSLPTAESSAAVSLSTNGYLYVIGGQNGSNVPYVYYASTQNITTVGGDLTASGALTLQSTANSTNALQVQNASGSQLLNVNTSDNVISLNATSPMNGASGQWGTASYLPNDYDGASSVTVNGNIYYIGGYDGTNYVTDVTYASSAADGSVGSWKTANSLPSGRAFASAVTMNGYIYVMGGNASGVYSSAVYYAKVNADGSLGTWQTTTSLTGVRAYGAATTANGYIYYVGGRSASSTYQSTIYYAAPNAATGAITSWTTATSPIPVTRGLESTVSANNFLYVMGGTSDGTTFSSSVYYATLSASTGAVSGWVTSSNSLPNPLGDTSAITSGGYAYIIGGYDGGSVSNNVLYAALNSDGTTGAWQKMTKTLPENVNFGAVAAANGYLYVLGGYTGSYFLDTVYSAALQGVIALNGNVGSVGTASFQSSTNSQSAFKIQNASGDDLLNVDTVNNVVTLNGGVGGALTPWQQTSSMVSPTSYGGYVAANGYAYTFGGYGSGYSSAVQFAPINADGTMGTWTSTTALPGARGYTTATSAAGFVYVIGGYDGSSNQNTIYYAKQNTDGTLGAWLTSSITLPSAMNAMSATVANGYLYILGGTNGSYLTTVSYAHINGDGSINAFATGTPLPTGLANANVVTANGYIYYLGGSNGTSSVATVYYSALNMSTGANGAWTSTTTMPSAAANFAATVANGNLYIFRGSSLVYYSSFNSDGTLDKWIQDSNSFPVSYNGESAISYNGYIYVLGGYTGSVGTTGVYYSSGARTMVAGTLDLVGLTTSGSLASGSSAQSSGSVSGALIAGNTTIVGTLQVQGQSSFNQNVAINGDSLTVGNDSGDPATGSTLITVRSRGYAGLQLYGDTANTAGEQGGAFVQFGTDSATQLTGTTAFIGISQVDANSPLGNPYTGVLNNALVLGTNTSVGAVQLGTNLTTRLTVTTAGHVCIAITSCTHTLGVTGTIAASSTITASGTPDIAETIPSAPDVEAADVVMADPNNAERAIKSNGAYNGAVLGVISDGTSSFLINAHGNNEGAALTGMPLVLAGRVPVKVTNEAGAIRPGDYLTSSSTPGYAMKATHAGPTIGKALGYFDGNTGTVLVLVNVSYADPDGGLQGNANSFQNINVAGDAVLNDVRINSVTVSGDATINGDLTVMGATSVGTITINGHIITQGDAPQVALEAAAGQNASVTLSGNDTSGVLTITAGTQATADDLAKVIFNKPFGKAPRIVITPVGKDSAQINGYIDQTTTADFMVGTTGTPDAGAIYTFNYQIME